MSTYSFRKALTCALLGSTFSLAGCGGSGPSEGDIKAAITKAYEQGSVLGPEDNPLKNGGSLNKLECVESQQAKAYSCNIELVKSTGGKSRVIPLPFVKGSQGWEVMGGESGLAALIFMGG